MRRIHFLLFLLCIYLSTAHAQDIPPRLAHQWHKLANQPPGTLILIKKTDDTYPTWCRLIWIDNNAIACEGENGRLIFPATTIASVTRSKPKKPFITHPGLLVAAGIGGVLGGFAGSGGGAADTALGVILGSTLIASIGVAVSANAPSPPPYWYARPLTPPHAPAFP